MRKEQMLGSLVVQVVEKTNWVNWLRFLFDWVIATEPPVRQGVYTYIKSDGYYNLCR